MCEKVCVDCYLSKESENERDLECVQASGNYTRVKDKVGECLKSKPSQTCEVFIET